MSENHENFYSTTKGDSHNPLVILLHGLLGSSRNLLRLQESIANAGYYVLAYDQRGHGHSPHFNSYSLDEMAHDLFDIIKKTQSDRAHLIGHSMGARVCLAANRIETNIKIQSLTMLDAGTHVEQGGSQEIQKIIQSLPESFETRAQAEEHLKMHPPAIRQFLISNLRTRNSKLEWLFDLNGIRQYLIEAIGINQTDTWTQLREKKIPTLLVRGERSNYLSQNEFENLLRLYPEAVGKVIENAGHWLHADNFMQTSQTIIHFLNGLKKQHD